MTSKGCWGESSGMQRLWQIVGWIAGAGFIVIVLFFWLAPPSIRNDIVTWIGIGGSISCAIVVVLATRRYMATWPGFFALVLGSLGAHLWLCQRWSLWAAPNYLVRNANTVVGLLAIDLLVAILVDTVVMLISRCSAPVFLALVWLLYPWTLVGVARSYSSVDAFLASNNLRGQVLWGTPMTVFPIIGCLSLPAFLICLTIVLVKEIRGK